MLLIRPLVIPVVLAVGAGLLLASARPADADTFGDCIVEPDGRGRCIQDSANITYCIAESLNGYPLMKSTARWAGEFVGDQTRYASEEVTCSAATDIWFQRRDLGPGIRGTSFCVEWAGADHPRRCRSSRAQMDLGTIIDSMTNAGNAYDDGVEEAGEREFNMQKTWCHEAGHNLGFEHHPGDQARSDYYDGSGGTHDQDCMVSGHIELRQNWLRYNQHHRDHVAAVQY